MDVESYRVVVNRPKTLMGIANVFCFPNTLTGRDAGSIWNALRKKYPNQIRLKTLTYGGYTYIGVVLKENK